MIGTKTEKKNLSEILFGKSIAAWHCLNQGNLVFKFPCLNWINYTPYAWSCSYSFKNIVVLECLFLIFEDLIENITEQKMKLWIWSHLLKKSLLENFIFLCSVSRKNKIWFALTQLVPLFHLITVLFSIFPAHCIETDRSICTAIQLITFYMIFKNAGENINKEHR